MDVWEVNGDKSPGTDDFNLRFLQECWKFMEDDFVKFIMEFYNSAILPKAITTSFLALIPKNANL